MSNIALPTNEAEFSWHGGCRSPSETRELAFGVDALNLPGAVIPNADISEFGHLIRSVSTVVGNMRLGLTEYIVVGPGIDPVQDHGSIWAGIARSCPDFQTCCCLGSRASGTFGPLATEPELTQDSLGLLVCLKTCNSTTAISYSTSRNSGPPYLLSQHAVSVLL